MFLYLSHALCSVEASRTYAQLLIRTMFVRYNTWSTRIKALDINIIPYVALQAIMFSHAPAGSWILLCPLTLYFSVMCIVVQPDSRRSSLCLSFHLIALYPALSCSTKCMMASGSRSWPK